MSKIALSGSAAGSGTFTLAAPNSDSSYTLNLPQVSGGTLVSTDASGNVGIGTSTTNGRFTVDGGNLAIRSSYELRLLNSDNTNSCAIWNPAATGGGNEVIAFKTGASERARVDSTGNFGINTTSPGSKLHVVGAGGFGNGAASSAATISSPGTGNSATTLGITAGGSPFDIVVFTGSASPGNAVVLNQRNNAPLIFQTNNTERARFAGTGVFAIGTTESGGNIGTGGFGDGAQIWAAGANSPAFTACNSWAGGVMYLGKSVGGSGQYIEFFQQGNSRGTITGTGTGVTYNTASDYRLKENIQPMQNALAVVAQLKPVTYTWKETGTDGQGFIAHELQAVVPDAVTGDKDAVYEDGTPKYQGIDTSLLVATLTKAIQEQQEQINELKAQVAALTKA